MSGERIFETEQEREREREIRREKFSSFQKENQERFQREERNDDVGAIRHLGKSVPISRGGGMVAIPIN